MGYPGLCRQVPLWQVTREFASLCCLLHPNFLRARPWCIFSRLRIALLVGPLPERTCWWAQSVPFCVAVIGGALRRSKATSRPSARPRPQVFERNGPSVDGG